MRSSYIYFCSSNVRTFEHGVKERTMHTSFVYIYQSRNSNFYPNISIRFETIMRVIDCWNFFSMLLLVFWFNFTLCVEWLSATTVFYKPIYKFQSTLFQVCLTSQNKNSRFVGEGYFFEIAKGGFHTSTYSFIVRHRLYLEYPYLRPSDNSRCRPRRRENKCKEWIP